MIRRVLVSIALLLLIVPALAHDYWLQADSFFLPVGGHTSLHLHVGSLFKSELERPLQKQRTIRFQMLSTGETVDLLKDTEDGQTPVVQVTTAKAGNYLLVMERTAQLIQLDAEKFNEYLSEEGLSQVIEERTRAGESGKDGRERYTRYIKALLQAGDRHDETYRRVTGQRLEIVPQVNPYRLRVGDKLKVRVTFEGRPLAGARIFAFNHTTGDAETHTLATNLTSDGTATLKPDRPGIWLVRLVYMRRCTGCADADWESFWAAYTFELK